MLKSNCKLVARESGFLKPIDPGNVIIAGRGDDTAFYGGKLVILSPQL